MKRNAGLLLLALAFSAGAQMQPALAAPVTFVVNDPDKRDLVSFTSDAPIELIVGRTHNITGKINIDDSLDLSKKPLEATFDVDLASIDTGIELRNEHMRDNFLQTKQFPKATFKMTSVGAPVVLKDGQTVKLKATGDFSLHGKTVKRDIPVDVTYRKTCKGQAKFDKCDLLQIRSTFPVAFKDYAIQRPEIVFQKLADTVIVTLAATAHADASGGAAKSAASSAGAAKPAAAKKDAPSAAKTAPAKAVPAKPASK